VVRARQQKRGGDKPSGSDPLLAEATEIARLLREVSRRYLIQPVDADREQSGLTVPQILVISVLFDNGPLALKDLSQQVGLSHSTVSGIVDRLERHGLAQRSISEADRRVSLISVTDVVLAYGREGYRARQLGRLLPAMRAATAAQRTKIKEGLALLHSLVTDQTE